MNSHKLDLKKDTILKNSLLVSGHIYLCTLCFQSGIFMQNITKKEGIEQFWGSICGFLRNQVRQGKLK